MATTRIEGSVFSRHGSGGAGSSLDQYLIRSDAGASTEVLHSTIADNNSATSVFGISSINSIFKLHSSIVHDVSSGNVLADNPGGTVSIDCVIAHETGSLTGGTHLLATDPMFVDTPVFNYHINSETSRAVDFCNNNLVSPQNKDIDYENFGWDDPNVNNTYGPYDIGADETYENDVIFRSGFD